MWGKHLSLLSNLENKDVCQRPVIYQLCLLKALSYELL